jgi:hypothetical protein
MRGRRRIPTILCNAAIRQRSSMMDALPNGLVDVRPLPVFVVGVTGHRQNSQITAHAATIAANVQNILVRLRRGVVSVCADSKFLYPARPILRIAGMAAEGADLIAMKAAHDLSFPIACVLPFPIEEYRKDFAGPPSLALLDEIVGASESKLELTGIRGEGARSYERANDIIISNCDLLIAVWDGMEARGRAGTGDVVQQAFEREIPIIVIDPASPNDSQLLVKSRDQAVDGMRALESERKPLPDDFAELAFALLTPPHLRGSQRILEDLYAEKKTTRSFRFEYALLLKVFGAARIKKEGFKFDEQLAWTKARETSFLCDKEWPARIDTISRMVAQLDQLASHYGKLYRSSSASGYFLAIVISLSSGILGILIPSISTATLSIQGVVGALIFVDRWVGMHQRWQEKWLTYRCMSERLKALRFLQVFGLSSHFVLNGVQSTGLTSTEWFVRRTSRAIGLPKGTVSSAVVESGFEQLAEFEIKGQIAYHRGASRQLGILERRLSWAANISILGIVMIVLAPSVAIWMGAAKYEASIRAFAGILLAMLPAALAAFNGIRADADLIRLTERSAWSSAYLSKLRRAMARQAPTFDKYEESAKKTASFLAAELLEWHMVLESRRTRLSRRRAFRNGLFRRVVKRVGYRAE